MFPANARALLLPPSGRGVLLGDDNYGLPVVGKSRHRTAIDKLSGGRKLQCAALLTRAGRDYDRYGVMVTIRGQEVGFLPWIDGHHFRKRLREAGFLEAVCKAEITGEHVIGDSWDYVGVAIDALMPFTFMSPEEWHNQHIPPDEREPAVRGSHQKIVSVIESLSQSLLKASSLRGLRYTDLTRLLHRTGSRISPPKKPERFAGSGLNLRDFEVSISSTTTGNAGDIGVLDLSFQPVWNRLFGKKLSTPSPDAGTMPTHPHTHFCACDRNPKRRLVCLGLLRSRHHLEWGSS